MARAIWNGTISFGLVNIPIKLYSAVSKKNVSFNQIDSRTGTRIRMQRVAADGTEVPYEHIVKGYEVAPERYVLIEPQELDSLDPEASRTIDIEEFIDLADIDPIFFDSAYYVAPAKTAAKPYALLVAAMESEGKVAIARFVLRTKQYLAALRAKDGKLLLSTMVFADEVVPTTEVPEMAELDAIEVSERELAMAKQLVESLSTRFEPERYEDTYRERVLDLIERKAQGEEVRIEAPTPEPSKVVDLMAALEASVKEARTARGRHPSAAAGDDGATEKAGDEKAGSGVAGSEAAAGDDPASGNGQGEEAAPAKKAKAARARKSA